LAEPLLGILYRRLRIHEFKPVNLEGGYLIDGFPSVGFSSAIATESMIHTSNFEIVGIIDSESFPPVSLIKDGKPNYPTRIYVNNDLKVAIFSSYLMPHESIHRTISRTMLGWARRHKISLIVSSVAVRGKTESQEIMAAGSTEYARNKLKEAGITILTHGAIPGIPGVLLNEGMMNNQNVAVILFHSTKTGPDFKSSAELCMAMSRLVPGASCDIPMLQKEAEKAEQEIKEADEGSRMLRDEMYR